MRAQEVESLDTRKIMRIYQKERRAIPSEKITAIFGFVLINLILLLMKGSSKSQSILGFESCGSGYYIMIGVTTIFSIIFYIYYRQNILKLETEKESLKYYDYVDTNEPKKNESMITSLFLQSGYVSILGSLLGLGGGVIMTPLLVSVTFLFRLALTQS